MPEANAAAAVQVGSIGKRVHGDDGQDRRGRKRCGGDQQHRKVCADRDDRLARGLPQLSVSIPAAQQRGPADDQRCKRQSHE